MCDCFLELCPLNILRRKQYESNYVETIDRTNLNKQTKIRLDKITEIENYFYQEINRKKLCSKKLRKYVTAFDYIDKFLVVLSATTGGVSIRLRAMSELL